MEEFRVWKDVFDSHAGAHRAAGLHLRGLWRGVDDPDLVFFLFDVEDRRRAHAAEHPASAAAATLPSTAVRHFDSPQRSTGHTGSRPGVYGAPARSRSSSRERTRESVCSSAASTSPKPPSASR